MNQICGEGVGNDATVYMYSSLEPRPSTQFFSQPCEKKLRGRPGFEATCTELKITAGPRPFSVQFATMATQNLIMIVSNCTDGQSKFQFGQPNSMSYFQLCMLYVHVLD